MGFFDRAARRATQEDPHAVIHRLGQIAKARWKFEEWEPTQTAPSPQGRDQTADRLANLENLEAAVRRWLAVLEFQAQENPDKLDDLLAECAAFRRDRRHGADRTLKFDVVPVLIYLVGHSTEAEKSLDMRTPGGFGSRHDPVIWNLGDDKVPDTLDAFQAGMITWGILFFVPLMAGAEDANLVERWLALVNALPDEEQKANLLGIAMVFAGLAKHGQVWRRVLERWSMTESPIFNEWVKEARLDAQLGTLRETLLRFLAKKFKGRLQADVIEVINSQTSMTVLNDWVEEAAITESPEDFRNYLRR